MTTRVLSVDYPLAGTGQHAAGELTVGAEVTATAQQGKSLDTALTATAAATASLTATLAAAASGSTTAAITATASVAFPTDISTLIVPADLGTNVAATLTAPGYDAVYTVNMADARFGSNYAQNKGVTVTLPTPSTPNVGHWIAFSVTVSDRSRRFTFNPFAANWKITGTVVEPSTTVGANATIIVSWDTTSQGWYVSSYAGSTSVREHGPNEATGSLPLYASPETRALADWSSRKTAALAALATVPPDVQTVLAAKRNVVDLESTSSAYLEGMFTRGIYDPSYGSGTVGVYSDPYINARAALKSDGTRLDGRTMLHEIGHAWDKWALASLGYTWGIDPAQGTPNAYDTLTTYHSPGVLESVSVYTPTTIDVTVYDTDGTTVIFGGVYDRPQYAYLSAERTIVDLLAPVRGSGDYYVSNEAEFTAQQLMLCWAAHDPTLFDTGGYADLGGTNTMHADFRAYVVSVGALPSSW